MALSKKAVLKKRRGQRIALEQQRRMKRNATVRTMRRMAAVHGVIDIFDEYAARRPDLLGFCFGRLRFEPAPDSHIEAGLVRRVREDIAELLEREAVVSQGGESFSLMDVFTAGISLHLFGLLLKHDHTDASRRLLDGIAPLSEVMHSGGTADTVLSANLQAFATQCSRINKGNLWFTRLRPSRDGNLALTFHVHWAAAEVVHERLDGKVRPLYRVASPLYHDLVWRAEISSADCEGFVDCRGPNAPLFVQAHVLHRFSERCDLLHPGIGATLLALAALTPRFVRAPDGALLLRVAIADQTLGYLVVEPVGDKLVARTFLFVTQAGTPEGDKLTAEIRIRAQERRFLELDRLSTFLKTDLLHDAGLRAIFDRCGLQNMLDVQQALLYKPVERCAERVRRYLRLDEWGQDGAP